MSNPGFSKLSSFRILGNGKWALEQSELLSNDCLFTSPFECPKFFLFYITMKKTFFFLVLTFSGFFLCQIYNRPRIFCFSRNFERMFRCTKVGLLPKVHLVEYFTLWQHCCPDRRFRLRTWLVPFVLSRNFTLASQPTIPYKRTLFPEIKGWIFGLLKGNQWLICP